MRNLKKLLSLVLAVAMLASFCVVGASAADTYSETTKYPEAAAVVTSEEVGVIDGFEDGTMRYDAAVTREQAAAIICRILLGTETAAKLSTATAPFTDVAANRWSAPYIAYLKNHGIVSGVTDTTFNPTGAVTGLQFAKMLLSAAGYGVNGEYDGASWDINTITDANAHNVFADTQAADLAAGATREECMLYAFNAMTKMPVVKYNKTFESYYTGTSALDPVNGDVDPTQTGKNAPYAYTMAYANFKLYQTTGKGNDDFGRPSTNWVVNGTTIAENIANEVPTATFTGAAYSANLYTALGKTIVKNLNAHKDNITVYVDGDAGVINTSKWADIKSGEFTNQFAFAGATTELYASYDDDSASATYGQYFLTIVVSYEHIGKVTKATTSALTIDGKLTASAESLDIKGIAKNDYVIYTIGKANDAKNAAVATVAKADYITGTYTGTNAMLQAVIDGKAYTASNVNDGVYSALKWTLTLDTAYKIYTDSLGNILKAEVYDDAAATNNYQYLYVTGAEVQPFTGSILNGKEAKVALSVVYPAGGADVVYYAVKYSASKYQSEAGGYYITLDGKDVAVTRDLKVNAGWYAFTKNDAGNVTLKGFGAISTAATTDSVKLVPGRATVGIDGFTANSKTVLNVVDIKGNVATYTGITNFPTLTGTNVLYTYTPNKIISTINVYTGTDAVKTTVNYALCMSGAGSTSAGNRYVMYFGGKAETITVDTVLATGVVYNLTLTNGEYSADAVGAYKATGATNDKGTVNAGYGMGKLPEGGYGYTDMVTFMPKYAEYATVDVVDANYFTTVAVSADDAADSVVGKETAANTYYYDANTKIVDTTGKGATELTSGNVFVAFVDEAASNAYAGAMYVSYVWIIA